jgi:hypothetical protein
MAASPAAPACPHCAHLQCELHLATQGLAPVLAWGEERRTARNAAEDRLRRQDRVLAALVAGRVDDRRQLAQQAEWLAGYVTRMRAAVDAVTRRRAQLCPVGGGPTAWRCRREYLKG